jgi:hypothetical protein
VAAGLSPVAHPPSHCCPQMMTRPPREAPIPREPLAPCERPPTHEPPTPQPCDASELSAAPGCAATQEFAPVAVERPLCPASKNITFVKQNITMNSNEQV